MLSDWGATCGRCRPAIPAPRTLVLSQLDASAFVSPPLALGWLLVIRSPDPQRVGALLELSAPRAVVSRKGVTPVGGADLIDFEDDFMSTYHATVFRPARDAQDAPFTLQDRQEPGPSANGTFLNSHRLAGDERASLSDGDSVRLGTTEFIFKSLWLPSSAV